MNKELYEEQQPRYLEYLAFLYFLSSIFFLGALIPFHRMMWATLLCGGLLSLPLLFGIHKLIHRFGIGKPLLALTAVLSAMLCALTLYCLSEFLYACVLQELPIWLFPTGFLLCCIYAAVKDIHVLERLSKLCGPVVLLLLFLAVCSGISKVRLSFSFGFFSWRDYLAPSGEAFLSGVLFFTALFCGEGLVLLTMLNFKRKTPAIFKDSAKGFLISIVFLSAAYLVTVLALGPDVFELLTYPVYYPPGLTGTAEYLERIEVILLAVFILSEFVKTAVCLMMIKDSLLVILGGTAEPSIMRKTDSAVSGSGSDISSGPSTGPDSSSDSHSRSGSHTGSSSSSGSCTGSSSHSNSRSGSGPGKNGSAPGLSASGTVATGIKVPPPIELSSMEFGADMIGINGTAPISVKPAEKSNLPVNSTETEAAFTRACPAELGLPVPGSVLSSGVNGPIHITGGPASCRVRVPAPSSSPSADQPTSRRNSKRKQ